jgi:hypothetical protein
MEAMKRGDQASRSLGSLLGDQLRPLPPAEQRSSVFPLQMALRSGRIAEHRQAAEYLASLRSQPAQAEAIARALVLLQTFEELAKTSPELRECTLAKLAQMISEGKG